VSTLNVLYSLIYKPMIIAHVLFMREYYRSWWDPHFQWHKSTDKLTHTPGFRAVEMAVHHYVQDRDLRNLIGNWKDNDHFTILHWQGTVSLPDD